MIDRRGLLLSSAAASLAAAANRAVAASPASRRDEVRALRRFAEETHPRGREAAANEDWNGRWSALEAGADALGDGAYFIALRRGLGWFQDGHTTPLPFEFTGGVPDALKNGPFGLSLPVRVDLFQEGAFITRASPEHQKLLGMQVERIGRLPASEIIRANARDWPGNTAWAHRWAGAGLTSPALLQGLGATAGAGLPVQFGLDGGPVTLVPGRILADLHEVTRPTTAVERWNGEAGRGLFVKPLADRSAVYLSIDDMADSEGYSFIQFSRDAIAALALDWPQRLVIDLRRNGGGNNFLGEALRKAVAASRFNRPGGLFVLIGPKTFSAAQNLANRLERETFALFVGEPTGGAPSHYGDAKPFVGPATGITSIVSTLPWFDSYPQDKRPWILPDLPVPQTFADWKSGDDRALELALSHRADGPADFVTRDRVFYYERASQKTDWKPFWA